MSVMIVGLDSFITGLGAAKDATKKVVEAAALNMALQVRRIAQDKAPKASTALSQSIQALPQEYGAMTTVVEKYGLYVEMGTGMFDPRGAHLIYPHSANGVLAWSSGGQGFFARWTRGMESQPFFWPAVKETEPYIITEMAKAASILIGMAVKA